MPGEPELAPEPSGGPEIKALLRLLSYALAEANNMGLEECAELINRAAAELRRQLSEAGRLHPEADLTRLH